MIVTALSRLHAQIAAVCPIDGVAVLDPVAHTVRIDYQASATAAQKTAAQSVVSGFDWSAAGDAAYEDAQEPDLATMRDNATSAFNGNTTYLAIASPSTAQNTAQIKALTQQNQKIIKALARLVFKAL